MAIWFQAMATKMESLFAELADYFVFDSQKYTLEEFMSDIKMFKNQFKVQLFFFCWDGMFCQSPDAIYCFD